MTSGIHHITFITRKVQANVDFYVGFLGLRLVKRTGGFEDAQQLHLMYGDSDGSPGSLVTFLAWEDGAPGRVGLGQVAEFSLAVPSGSLGFWISRALEFGISMEGPQREFDETFLRLKDPDGIVVKLVGASLEGAAAPAATKGISNTDAVRRLRGATLLSSVPEETIAFLERYFGYVRTSSSDTTYRMVSASGDVIDVRNASGFWPGAPGTGVADHVAFRAVDLEALQQVEKTFASLNSSDTNSHDRKYFHSLYVREPGGTLFELATDGPGLTVDETLSSLGTTLFFPPTDSERATDLAVMLPQFALPDEARVAYRDLPFVHRFYTPHDPDGTTIVLLHGSGGSEADLMPLANRIAPQATLLGVRGRSTEEQTGRWFRRHSATSFDEADIRSEAEAFAAFLEMAIGAYGIDPRKLVILGYSNGANFAVATMLLHPGSIEKAILFRPSLVMSPTDPVELTGTEILIVNGSDDNLAELLPSPELALKQSGAMVHVITVTLGHTLGSSDVDAGREGFGLLVE